MQRTSGKSTRLPTSGVRTETRSDARAIETTQLQLNIPATKEPPSQHEEIGPSIFKSLSGV